MNWYGTQFFTSQGPQNLIMVKLDNLLQSYESYILGNYHPTCLGKNTYTIRVYDLHFSTWCSFPTLNGVEKGSLRCSQLLNFSYPHKIKSPCDATYSKYLPYHQAIDGKYWCHIFLEIVFEISLFKGHFDRIFIVHFSKKPLNNFQKGLRRERWDGFTTPGNRRIVVISLHDLIFFRSAGGNSPTCKEMGPDPSFPEPNHGFFWGYGVSSFHEGVG